MDLQHFIHQAHGEGLGVASMGCVAACLPAKRSLASPRQRACNKVWLWLQLVPKLMRLNSSRMVSCAVTVAPLAFCEWLNQTCPDLFLSPAPCGCDDTFPLLLHKSHPLPFTLMMFCSFVGIFHFLPAVHFAPKVTYGRCTWFYFFFLFNCIFFPFLPT